MDLYFPFRNSFRKIDLRALSGIIHSLLICYSSLVVSTSATKTPRYFCPAEEWQNSGDTCYHVLERTAKWTDVQSVCDHLKSQFAYVDDKEDMNALARSAATRGAPSVWLKGSNTQHSKSGNFVWLDSTLSEVDPNITPWAPGFPPTEQSVNQFIYMKVDLDSKKPVGLASSSGSVERSVACMMPAKIKPDGTDDEQFFVKGSQDLVYSKSAGYSPRVERAARHRRRHHRRRFQAQFAGPGDDKSLNQSWGETKTGIKGTAEGVGQKITGTANEAGRRSKNAGGDIKDGAEKTGDALSGANAQQSAQYTVFLFYSFCTFFSFVSYNSVTGALYIR